MIIPAIDIWGARLSAPFYPETVKLISEMTPKEIWNRYVRYIGAGAVACGGMISLARALPVILEAIRMIKDRKMEM